MEDRGRRYRNSQDGSFEPQPLLLASQSSIWQNPAGANPILPLVGDDEAGSRSIARVTGRLLDADACLLERAVGPLKHHRCAIFRNGRAVDLPEGRSELCSVHRCGARELIDVQNAVRRTLNNPFGCAQPIKNALIEPTVADSQSIAPGDVAQQSRNQLKRLAFIIKRGERGKHSTSGSNVPCDRAKMAGGDRLYHDLPASDRAQERFRQGRCGKAMSRNHGDQVDDESNRPQTSRHVCCELEIFVLRHEQHRQIRAPRIEMAAADREVRPGLILTKDNVTYDDVLSRERLQLDDFFRARPIDNEKAYIPSSPCHVANSLSSSCDGFPRHLRQIASADFHARAI
jgi:hypothetical protein